MNRTQHDITKFMDFRAFLLAHAQESRARNPRWTFGVWAKMLGLKGTASITRILKGERDPGEKLTQALIQYFGFDGDAAEYFKDLIRLHKASQDPRLGVALLEKMGKQYPNSALRVLDDRSFEVISNWYTLVIREMVRLRDFEEDAESIAHQIIFPITSKEVNSAIANLLELGLLSRSESGRLKITEGRIHTPDDLANEAIKRFHERMLENAKMALRLVPVNNREISAVTLSLPSHALPKAKELIREFQDKFSKLFEQEQGDTVFQFQIQLFPLTRSVQHEELH